MSSALPRLVAMLGFGTILLTGPTLLSAQVDSTRSEAIDSTDVLTTDSLRTQPGDTTHIQTVDSTGVMPAGQQAVLQHVDSSHAVIHNFTDDPYPVGAVIDSVPLQTQYHLDLTSVLARSAGSFTYDLGNLGWPHQWSYLAMPPEASELQIDGITLRDPATHRTLFDAVPIDIVQPVRKSALAHGGAHTLLTRIRPLNERRPYTELRYEIGARRLQSISGFHVQQRQWRILGAPTVTQFVARLGFHEWGGGYPNSRSNLSQVFGRVGFQSRRWRIRFTDSYTLRTRGAHGGVIPNSGGFDSVYDRLGASVEDPAAEQRFQRNQFDVTVEHTWETDLKPLVITTSFVRSLYRYTNQDTSETKSSEFHLRLEQEFPEIMSGHELVGRISFASADLVSVGLINGGGGATKSRFVVSVDDQFRIASLDARAMVGLHNDGDVVYPSAGLSLIKAVGSLWYSAEGSINGRAPSPLEVSGGLGIESSQSELSKSLTQSLRASVGSTGRVFELEATGFVTRVTDPIGIVERGEGSYEVIQSPGSVTWVGLTGTIGWRARSGSGFYAKVTPTLSSASASSPDATSTRLAASLPDLHGNARFGYRKLLFKGDLDANVIVIGRFWTGFGSRTYDPVHALLVLPSDETPRVDASGAVDVRFEAGIREARLFFSLDNILARLVYPGALIVPVYPMPDQAFRFGVFWPIWG